MMMPRLLSFLFVLVPCLASATTADVPLHPFHAEYRTLRDGDAVGITMLVLATAADGTWTLNSETRGTNGLARLAGIHVVETSHFRWIDGHLQALDYDYRQDSAFKSRRRHADFDWATSTASVTEGHESHRYPVPGNVIDRQSVTLALAIALARDASDLTFPVAVKDRVETVDYRRAGEEPVTVPAGTFRAVAVTRTAGPEGGRKRVSEVWFAPSLRWLPVRIRQSSGKGDDVTLELAAIPPAG